MVAFLASMVVVSAMVVTNSIVAFPASTPASKTYRITVKLDAAALDLDQGESVTAMTLTGKSSPHRPAVS